jgi:uncharacterized protein (DUF2249 family)
VTGLLPEVVAAAGTQSAELLDVRPILAKGGDPFHVIMQTVSGLPDERALHLVVGFEPVPLYAVMATLGRRAHVDRQDGVCHVWFYRDKALQVGPPPGALRAPLKPPVELDVRGLEPPQPMVVILERLSELGPGGRLRVRHHREPVLLYEKLKLRGYAARCRRRAEGDYLVDIAPAWAIEEGLA